MSSISSTYRRKHLSSLLAGLLSLSTGMMLTLAQEPTEPALEKKEEPKKEEPKKEEPKKDLPKVAPGDKEEPKEKIDPKKEEPKEKVAPKEVDPKEKVDPKKEEPKKEEPKKEEPKKEEPKEKIDPKEKVDPVAPKTEIGGAKQDDIPEGFRAYIVSEPRFDAKDFRNREGKIHDLVCEHSLNPVLAVFSRTVPEKEDPIRALIKKQDDIAEKYKAKRIGSFVIFLTLKDEFRKDETRDIYFLDKIPALAKEEKYQRTTLALAEATVIPEGAEQPVVSKQVQNMKIADGDAVTVIFYNRYRIVKRWNFAADKLPTEADLTAIAEEVDRFYGPTKK